MPLRFCLCLCQPALAFCSAVCRPSFLLLLLCCPLLTVVVKSCLAEAHAHSTFLVFLFPFLFLFLFLSLFFFLFLFLFLFLFPSSALFFLFPPRCVLSSPSAPETRSVPISHDALAVIILSTSRETRRGLSRLECKYNSLPSILSRESRIENRVSGPSPYNADRTHATHDARHRQALYHRRQPLQRPYRRLPINSRLRLLLCLLLLCLLRRLGLRLRLRLRLRLLLLLNQPRRRRRRCRRTGRHWPLLRLEHRLRHRRRPKCTRMRRFTTPFGRVFDLGVSVTLRDIWLVLVSSARNTSDTTMKITLIVHIPCKRAGTKWFPFSYY